MPEKPKLTLGKQLMDFIDENGLVDNRVPVPRGSIAHDEGRTSGWRKDAEAKINEFMEERAGVGGTVAEKLALVIVMLEDAQRGLVTQDIVINRVMGDPREAPDAETDA